MKMLDDTEKIEREIDSLFEDAEKERYIHLPHTEQPW